MNRRRLCLLLGHLTRDRGRRGRRCQRRRHLGGGLAFPGRVPPRGESHSAAARPRRPGLVLWDWARLPRGRPLAIAPAAVDVLTAGQKERVRFGETCSRSTRADEEVVTCLHDDGERRRAARRQRRGEAERTDRQHYLALRCGECRRGVHVKKKFGRLWSCMGSPLSVLAALCSIRCKGKSGLDSFPFCSQNGRRE